ncbi:hypothetical protein L211DRAFT_644923 [Terfezia boudieri ATCC MYA-4762]|uniref:C2H2-type domain-containing protein n=1 Tax=Terfezia boudieri ATCC MYA-4762 TaxID=1051890 RepID=A0A3N4M138_9PEZI|nr:hypothetical protein L211DRAFT_644923 [Terfezia boudieri ATCC MYA-4762]
MDKPPETGSCNISLSKWVDTLPRFLRQPAITANADELLGHPLPHPLSQAIPESQVVSRSRGSISRASTSRASTSRASTSRASTRRASTSRASTNSRVSNTRASARKTSTAKKTFKCKECGKLCRDAWTLQDHMPKHFDEQPFVCNDCGGGFRRLKDLKSHTKNTCPSKKSQVDAALSSHRIRKTPSERQFVITTPGSYERYIQNKIEEDLESESGNEATILHESMPMPFDFLSGSRYEPPYTPPQPTMSELDGVPDAADLNPDVLRVLYDPKFTQAYGILAESKPINRHPEDIHSPHSTIVGTLSTRPNSMCKTGSGLPFTMLAPSSSSETGSPKDVGVPPLDDGTESESPLPSSLNTDTPRTSQRSSLPKLKCDQGLQGYDQSCSSADYQSPLLNPPYSAFSQSSTAMTNDTRGLGNADGTMGFSMAEDNRNGMVAAELEWQVIVQQVERDFDFQSEHFFLSSE